MTASPDFSPDNIQLTYTEIAELCTLEDVKRLGGLAITSNEPLAVMGWKQGEAGEPDLVIPRGDSGQLLLHANHVGGLDQLRTDLAKIASYVALHENLRNREHIVGITYRQLASLAVRGAGFRPIDPVMPEPEYVDRIRVAYNRLKIAQRQPFELAMFQMPVEELLERFAIKRLGRDPQLLFSMVAWKAAVPSEKSMAGGDPILPVLRQIIDSLRDEPDA